MDRCGIAYIHLSTNPEIPAKTYNSIRAVFNNTIIFCNGLPQESAEKIRNDAAADLVACGRGFLANPDFISRIEKKIPLNDADYSILCSPGELGSTDYPLYNLK